MRETTFKPSTEKHCQVCGGKLLWSYENEGISKNLDGSQDGAIYYCPPCNTIYELGFFWSE